MRANGTPGEDHRWLRSFLENSSEITKIVDLDGTLRYANPAFGRILGYDPEQVVGTMNVLDYVHPDDLPHVREEASKAVDEGGVATNRIEYRFRHADGSYKWVESVGTYLPGDKTVSGVVVTVRDVTKRKESEEKLRFQSRLLDAVGQAVVATDVGGKVVYWNRGAEKIFGFSSEEAMGRLAEDFGISENVLEKVAKSSEGPGTGTSWSGELTVLRKDGGSLPVLVTGTPLNDEQGDLIGIICVCTDLTERKEAEEALKESEERFRSQSRELDLLHRVRSAVAPELDVPSVLSRAVQAVVETYGYTQLGAYLLEGEELVLEHQFGYQGAIERIPITRGVCGRVIRTGRPVLVEDVGTDPDFVGAIEGVTSEICVPLFDEGETVGCLNVESTGGLQLTQNDLRVMVAVGEHVSVAVSRALLHARVRHSEERYRALTQNSSDLVTLMEATGIVRYQSPAIVRMLGYSPVELLGKNAFDYVHPDDLQRVETAYAESLQDPSARPSAEYRFRHKNGSWRWLESVGTNLTDEPGVGSYVVNSRDVTRRKEAEDRLREAEKKYRTLVEQMPAITYMQEVSHPSESVYVSPQVMDVVGYTPEECTSTPDLWVRILHPDDKERVLAEDARTNETGEPFIMEYRQFAKDGHVVWIRDEATLVRDEEGQPLYWLGVQIDITERKRAEKALGDAEQRYRTLVEQIPAVTYIDPVDDPDTSLYTSPQIERMLGYTPEEWRERKLWPERLHPGDRERILAADERFEAGDGELFSEEYRLLAKDGSVVWVREEAMLLKNEAGEPLYWQGVFYNITDRKALEEQLEHWAFHDHLTDLPNRQLFLDRLRQALDRTRRRKSRKVAVLFLDLDEFKIINDSLGHEAGDLLLTVVAQRLKHCLRPGDSLARFGGDEFVVLIEDIGHLEEAVRVAERITEELERPFLLDGKELFASSSIGIGLGNAWTKTPEGLLRDADTAMYRVKEEGGAFRVFDPTMYERARGRLELEGDLRRTLEAPYEQLSVFYQPMASIPTGEIVGMEALLRWNHPEHGRLTPSGFIPMAEETGLIVPMGRWVLGEACRRAKEWRERYPKNTPLTMAVNLSARQLRYPELVGEVKETLRQVALDPASLTLEITESVLVEVGGSSTWVLRRLKDLGVQLAIDDFGVGYSSLSYLRYLPVDRLKLDRVLVRNLDKDRTNLAIVRAALDLGHALGIEVVAEGVETQEEFEELRKLGCDVGQGNYWWSARPKGEAEELLASKLPPWPDRRPR
ncbi:MAG: PAS domain S-box protein [Rubrobacter sp.]|nr:PAS domain S-box protein [Rubrobacter sp.]